VIGYWAKQWSAMVHGVPPVPVKAGFGNCCPTQSSPGWPVPGLWHVSSPVHRLSSPPQPTQMLPTPAALKQKVESGQPAEHA